MTERFRCARRWLSSVLHCVVFAFACSVAPTARAAEPIALDVPAQALARTLLDIGTRFNVLVSFDPALLRQRAAPALRGRYGLAESLNAVLAGSGLRVQPLPGGALTVVADAAVTSEGAPPAAAVFDASQAQPVVLLDRVLVEGVRGREGLAALHAESATRSETPLADLPLSVSVITRDSLALQGEPVVASALGFVAGAHAPSNLDGIEPFADPPVSMRGLPVLPMISGVRTLRSLGSLEAAVTERIEVAKGPMAAIGGSSGPAGRGAVVDIALKRPGTRAPDELRVVAESVDGGTLRTSFDVSSRGRDGLTWRVAGYGDRSGRTDGGYDAARNSGALAAVRYRGSSVDTIASLLVDGRRVPVPAATIDNSEYYPSHPRPGQLVPISSADGLKMRGSMLDLDTTWQFAETWRLRLMLRRELRDTDGVQHADTTFYTYPQGSGLELSNAQVSHRAWQRSVQLNLSGRFTTGPIDHALMLGADADRWTIDQTRTQRLWVFDFDAPFRPGDTLPPADELQTIRYAWQDSYRQRGWVVQDQLTWGRATLHAAWRRGNYYELRRDPGVVDDDFTNAIPTGNAWDLGLSVRAATHTTLYAGFHTNRGTGDLPDYPTSLRQVQLGSKFTLFDERALLTMEAYRLEQRGILDFDLVGELRRPGRVTRGLEVEYTGRVTRDLDIALGMEWVRSNDSHVAYSIDQPAGTVVRGASTGVPSRALRLLAQYRLPQSWMPRTSVGMGWQAIGSRFVKAADPSQQFEDSSLRLPGHSRFEFSMTRDFEHFALDVGVRNLGSSRAYGNYAASYFIPLLPKRSFRLAARFHI